MKKFFSEFREFALRGNVMDLAVAVIIGAAFQAIVASLTQDIISPLIGLVACMDFSDLALAVGGVEIRYGAFLTAVINFIIMAFVIFCLVKAIAKLQTLGKTKYMLVEQDDCYGESAFDCLKRSHDNVRKMGY